MYFRADGLGEASRSAADFPVTRPAERSEACRNRHHAHNAAPVGRRFIAPRRNHSKSAALRDAHTAQKHKDISNSFSTGEQEKQ